MPSVRRDYLAADDIAANLEAVVRDALTKAVSRGGQAGRIVDDPATRVRRMWFDTFDWRLHKAGLMLELVETGRAESKLSLEAADGVVRTVVGSVVGSVVGPPAGSAATSQAGAPRAAFPLDDVVPEGELRGRLEPVVEMRALGCVASIRTTTKNLRVLNDDEKTVARVAIERSTIVGGSTHALAPRVSVVEIRGYEADAGSVEKALAKIPGSRRHRTRPWRRRLLPLGG